MESVDFSKVAGFTFGHKNITLGQNGLMHR